MRMAFPCDQRSSTGHSRTRRSRISDGLQDLNPQSNKGRGTPGENLVTVGDMVPMRRGARGCEQRELSLCLLGMFPRGGALQACLHEGPECKEGMRGLFPRVGAFGAYFREQEHEGAYVCALTASACSATETPLKNSPAPPGTPARPPTAWAHPRATRSRAQ